MLERSLSEDSSLVLRTNPLNIHHEDGSDLMLDAGSGAFTHNVPHNKPQIVSSPESLAQAATVESISQASLLDDFTLETADFVGLDSKASHIKWQGQNNINDAENNKSNDNQVTDVCDLDIPTAKLGNDLDDNQVENVCNLDIPTPKLCLTPDLGESFSKGFASFGLKRNNTITSRKTDVKSGPSRSPELIQRLRTIRKKFSREGVKITPKELADEPLPANLLDIITYSPASSFPAEEEDYTFEEEKSNQEIDEASNKLDKIYIEHQSESIHAKSTEPQTTQESSDVEKDPFFAGTAPKPGIMSDKEIPKDEPEPESQKHELEEPTSLIDNDPVNPDDRGRLFMQIKKISQVKGLPIDQSRNPRFNITLDNGLQVVTTPFFNLGSTSLSGTLSANVNQELELVVGKELDIVLTVSVAMDAVHPPPKPRHDGVADSKTATPPVSPSKKKLGFFSSPKRRKEKMAKEDQAIKAQQEVIRQGKEHDRAMEVYRRRRDIWKNTTGPNGEFARGYLIESHYESEIYGKARTYALPLYNEWASETPALVAEFQITLIFVPRLFGTEQLPSSLAEAQKTVKRAAEMRQLSLDGYLTQYGGDCNMWRRRWFTLRSNELVGHHEATKKVRTIIYMENALEIIDTAQKPSVEDMWCIYEDRSFQLVFRDGEILSFYADSSALKDLWVKTLQQSLDHCTSRKTAWTDLVLDSFDA